MDTSVPVTLLATDANGDALTYEVVSGPLHGTLTGSTPHLTYVPAAGFSGQDSFTWEASDGSATRSSTTVTLTVTAVNDAPVLLLERLHTRSTITMKSTKPLKGSSKVPELSRSANVTRTLTVLSEMLVTSVSISVLSR